MAFYLDTSAVVKLVVAEAETAALTAWIAAEQKEFVSCDLLRTELFRAVPRGSPDSVTRARNVVDAITILAVPSSTFERAGELAPPTLRSLDAIHLAATLELGDTLDGLVTYDEKLAAAAVSYGINVIAPGSVGPRTVNTALRRAGGDRDRVDRSLDVLATAEPDDRTDAWR
jgi:uncharacterized protein